MKIGPYEINQIYTGDARALSKEIPDESIDLILTDPVYQNIEDYLWLSNLAQRVLKPDCACLMWQGQQWLSDTICALKAGPLAYRWVLGWYASNNMQMVGKIGRKIAPCLWYEKGHSNPFNAVREVVDVPIPGKKPPFKWAKNPKALAYYLSKFANEDSIVFDPFSGMGSLPAVCKSFGINFLAFELEADRAESARERLAETPLPLPFKVLQSEQTSFDCGVYNNGMESDLKPAASNLAAN